MKKLFIVFVLICFSQFLEMNANISNKNTFHSGLEGTTTYKVLSGMPGGVSEERVISMEFGIAPIQNGQPAYDQMIIVKSDDQGQYRIALPPGKYWVGQKKINLDSAYYDHPVSEQIQEQIVSINPGSFTRLNLWEIGFAS